MALLSMQSTSVLAAPPVILVQPASVTTRVGASVTLNVEARGDSPVEYQWLKNGIALSAATSSSFKLYNIQPSDAATYTVVVTNPYGSVTSSPAGVAVITPLLITKDPTNQITKAGADATFSVQAVSALPLSYFWFKNGGLIPNATSNVLVLKNVQEADAASYTVYIYTQEGGLRSQPATLTISGALPPRISVQPLSRTNLIGSTASFWVQAAGGQPFSYQWFKNGLLLSNSVSSNLVLNAVQETNAGNYSVVVTNRAGSAISTVAALVVHMPPEFRVQPTNRIVFAGAAVTLVDEARGVPPPSYQWFRDGVPIPRSSGSSLSLCPIPSRPMPEITM